MIVLICATPLQVLIAEQITKLYPEEKFYGIMHTFARNTKYDYYYERMKTFCTYGTTYLVDNKMDYSQGLSYYRYVLEYYLLGYKLRNARAVITGHGAINSIKILLAPLLSRERELMTFDDGTINLSPYHFKKSLEEQPLGRLFTLMKVPTSKGVYAKSTRHYSIYRYPNAVTSPVTHLSLFAQPNTKYIDTPCEAVRIFLGQPLFEKEDNGRDIYISITESIVNQFEIKAYYPHPREAYRITNCSYIESPLIFEDYLIQKLANNPNQKYEIYGYCSTALINIQHPRVRCIAVKPTHLTQYEDVYQILSKLNVETIIL